MIELIWLMRSTQKDPKIYFRFAGIVIKNITTTDPEGVMEYADAVVPYLVKTLMIGPEIRRKTA